MRHVLGRDLTAPGVDPALVARWANGWALSRGLAPPVADGPALRIEVNAPDQRRRYIFPHPGPDMRQVAATVRDPLVFLKAPAPPDAVRSWLPTEWLVERTGTIMLLDRLPDAGTPVPNGYVLHRHEGEVTRVEVIGPDGEPAARGRLVIVDGVAVHDRIRTEAPHLRRGLGRAVMTALGQTARARGAECGMLSATDMGRALYATLGWRAVSPYTTAHRPA